MRKPLLKALIIFSLILTVFTACDHNVYMGEPERITPSLWKVNNTYFDSLQEAMDYIYGTTKGVINSKAIDDVGVTRRAILQRNVMNGERGGGLIVPADFKGQLVIDFNGFTYEFDNSLDHFFDVRGGDEVYIINGTTVIYNEADHEPYALAVNTDTVTIDEHLIDDRRWDPKLFDVGEKGKLRVVGIQETDAARLTGVVSVFTDGTSGGKLILEDSRVVITNILTRYKNPETGEISDSITLETIPAGARSEITISSGYVTINNIETLSDYYKKEGTEAAVLYSKAILKIFSGDSSNLTKIENPHDSTEKPIDTAIQTMINNQKIITETDVNHVIIHSFDDEHTHAAVDPTCTTPGNIYYVQCTYCNHYFDENNNQLSDDPTDDINNNGPVIPALGHISPLEHIDAVAATCTTMGNTGYWHCTRCGSYFSDEAGTTEISLDDTVTAIDPNNHNLEHVAAVVATCTETGIVEHWHCTRCNKDFSDADGTNEIANHEDVIVSALGHDYSWHHEEDGHWQVCGRCGHTTTKQAHIWGPEHPCSDGNHMVRECTVCGVIRNADEPGFDEYHISIGTIIVPKVVSSPCGELVVTQDGSTYTASYDPHDNSATPDYITCQWFCNGHWSGLLAQNTDGSFSFTVTEDREYKIVLQAVNEGGTLTLEKTVNE